MTLVFKKQELRAATDHHAHEHAQADRLHFILQLIMQFTEKSAKL